MGPPSPLRPIGDIAPGPYSVGSGPSRGYPPPYSVGTGGTAPYRDSAAGAPRGDSAARERFPCGGTLPLQDTPGSARAGLSRREDGSIPSRATRAGYPRYNAGTAGTP